MFRKIIFILATAGIIAFSNTALARIFIPIDQPADKKFPIAVADLVELEGSGVGNASKKISEIIRNDLELSGYFFVIPKKAYLDRSDAVTAETIDFSKWRMIDAQAVVKGAVQKVEGRIVVQLKLFDPHDREMLIGKQYTFETKELRRIAHRFSDEVMLSLTGIRGVFGTKIAFSAITAKRSKSIYIMDMDGENQQRITKDKSLNIGPAWSPDGGSLVFASYIKSFPEIYTVNLSTGMIRQLTSNRATNITPAWSPNGALIAYSSSSGGNMEIHIMDSGGQNTRRVTNSFGIDIAPRFSPDGNEFVYTSERGGSAHVYKSSISGGNSTRLTYVGSHNDSPDWSSDGQKVVFAGRAGVYDIYTVNIDGSNVQRLTLGTGSNEHPRWSPDGRYIVFSSTRSGKPQIYMMRYDGANQVLLAKKLSGVVPAWGPWEQQQ